MKKLLSIILIIFSIIFGVIGAEEEAPVIPMIPILPAFPSNMEADGEIMRKPLETKTVILGMEVEVVITKWRSQAGNVWVLYGTISNVIMKAVAYKQMQAKNSNSN